jgi:hypothetical protein
MPRDIAVRTDTSVGRPLKVLIPLIKDALAAGEAAGLEHYRRAGEMLLEARALIVGRAMRPRKNPHAVALGRKGGQAKSAAKTAAVRENAKKGGRPRKGRTSRDLKGAGGRKERP